MYLVFTRRPGESYRRRLRSLFLYLCYVFRALINSRVCYCRLGSVINFIAILLKRLLILRVEGWDKIANFVFWYLMLCPLREIRVAFPGKAQQPQEQRYPFLFVCVVFLCVQTMVWLPVSGIFNVTQMLMHATAHGGCMDTVRESAVEVDCGRKIACRTGDSKPRHISFVLGLSVGRSTN